MPESAQALIVDNGSAMSKFGLGGEETPRAVFPSVVGRPKDGASTEVRVGDEALKKKDSLELKHPVERGMVTNWDNMEALWHHGIKNELRVSPEEHPVLMSEMPKNPKENREKTAQIMFEKFGIPALHLANHSLLALHGSGHTTGLVLDSGHGVTHSVPIFEGKVLEHAIGRLEVAGKDVTEYLKKLLEENGHAVSDEVARDIKEKLSYVAEDFDDELKKAETHSYELPDGSELSLASELFRAPEILFKPNLIGKEVPGIHQLAHDSIHACDAGLSKALAGNIVFAGGSTMHQGIAEKYFKELTALMPTKYDASDVKMVTPPTRKFLTWIGGAVLSELSSFQDMWTSKADYEEHGTGTIHADADEDSDGAGDEAAAGGCSCIIV